MATACFRLLTFLRDRPDRALPLLYSRISCRTSLPALREYLRREVFFFVVVVLRLRAAIGFWYTRPLVRRLGYRRSGALQHLLESPIGIAHRQHDRNRSVIARLDSHALAADVLEGNR